MLYSFSTPNAWKCIDCLDLQHSVYDVLISGQGKELRWFCKACDETVMSETDSLPEIKKILTALITKSECIEAALQAKADSSVVEDLEMRISCVDQTANKLLQNNEDLRKELDKSFVEIKRSNEKLGETFQYARLKRKLANLSIRLITKTSSTRISYMTVYIAGTAGTASGGPHRAGRHNEKEK